jgi:hypothetical protein
MPYIAANEDSVGPAGLGCGGDCRCECCRRTAQGGFAGVGCGSDCRCSSCRSASLGAFGESTPTTRTVRVVVKSFINCIGTSVRPLPAWCGLMSYPKLLAMAAITDRLMCENPSQDRKDKGYRLYSACTFTITCLNGNVTAVTPSVLDTDTGKEGPLQAPPLIASPVTVRRTATGFDFSWFVRGRPHLGAEPGFQLVCPRTSVFIWHRINGSVRCTPDGTEVTINLTGSKFPTHRAYINGSPMRTVPQGGFGRLWFPAGITEPTRVEGLAETYIDDDDDDDEEENEPPPRTESAPAARDEASAPPPAPEQISRRLRRGMRRSSRPGSMRAGVAGLGDFGESPGPRVVLLPGIMGSRLVERTTGVPVWGDPAMLVAVGGGGIGLTLWHRVMSSGDGISSGGRVSARGLTNLPRIDPYSAIVADLNRAFGAANVLPFSYDWRLSNEHNASHLLGTIMLRWPDVVAGGNRRVHLIGHSMGGLVGRWMIERLGGSRYVQTLTTVGTPHFGAPEAMTLLAATSFGFIPGHSRASLIPGIAGVVRAVSGMAKDWGSVAQLLPGFDFVVPRGATSPEPISTTFARIRSGIDWAPIFRGSILRGPASRSIRNLNRGLIGGVPTLNATLAASSVRYFNIATTNHSTVVQALQVFGPAVRPITAVCGDGTVPGSSAVLPAGSHITPLFRTSAQEHGDLFNDAAIRSLCLSIVRGSTPTPASGPACAGPAPRSGLEGDLGCGACAAGEMEKAGLAETDPLAAPG